MSRLSKIEAHLERDEELALKNRVYNGILPPRELKDRRKLVNALRAVLKVHKRDPYNQAWCICEEIWPCETISAVKEAMQ